MLMKENLFLSLLKIWKLKNNIMFYIVPLDVKLWPSGDQGQYGYSKKKIVHQVGKKDYHRYSSLSGQI